MRKEVPAEGSLRAGCPLNARRPLSVGLGRAEPGSGGDRAEPPVSERFFHSPEGSGEAVRGIIRPVPLGAAPSGSIGHLLPSSASSQGHLKMAPAGRRRPPGAEGPGAVRGRPPAGTKGAFAPGKAAAGTPRDLPPAQNVFLLGARLNLCQGKRRAANHCPLAGGGKVKCFLLEVEKFCYILKVLSCPLCFLTYDAPIAVLLLRCVSFL